MTDSTGDRDRLVLDVVVRENTRSETYSDFGTLFREQFGAAYDEVEIIVSENGGLPLQPGREQRGDGTDRPPSNLSPEAVAGQVERVIRKNKDAISPYDKAWLQNSADYLRHLSADTEQ